MTEIPFPLKPRPRRDPYASGIVQINLEELSRLFEKGIDDGDILIWNVELGRYLARAGGGVDIMTSPPIDDLFDGREILIVDNLSAPTYHWHFRFNSFSLLSEKWEFIGGSPAHEQNPTDSDTTSTVYTNLPNIGPTLVLPAGVGGVFMIESGFTGRHDQPQNNCYMNFSINGGAVGGDDDAAIAHGNGVGGLGETSVIARRRRTGIPAGATIQSKYRSSTAINQARFRNRFLSITPVRIV